MRYQLFTRALSRPFSPALPQKLLVGRRELVVVKSCRGGDIWKPCF
jgi:hypothetical protein